MKTIFHVVDSFFLLSARFRLRSFDQLTRKVINSQQNSSHSINGFNGKQAQEADRRTKEFGSAKCEGVNFSHFTGPVLLKSHLLCAWRGIATVSHLSIKGK